MASFEAYFPRLLVLEGGYVDDPLDPGGATNKGITSAVFARYAMPLLGVAPLPATLRQLSDAQAATLYKALYWDAVKGDAIASQPLADIVFDFQVNAGAQAVRLLQRVLNLAGTQPVLAIDGMMGNATLLALQRADQGDIYRRYRQGRILYYRSLVARHPLLQKFLNGWLARAQSFPADIATAVAA